MVKCIMVQNDHPVSCTNHNDGPLPTNQIGYMIVTLSEGQLRTIRLTLLVRSSVEQ